MKNPHVTYQIAMVCVGFLVTGCGGSVTPMNGTAADRSGGHSHSWMLPEASSETLLYYTDYENAYALSYPQGKLVGTITGLDGAQGVCSDANGNVFVTTYYTESIYEYAHGGTEPIAKLEDYGYFPLGCAVDPVTGNLAVANTEAMNGNGGNVAVYAGATGKPTFYSVTGVYQYDYCAYDTAGNLYINGGGLTELPYGASSLSKISLDVFGAGIQWDGQYLAMIDGSQKKVYRIAISGSSGTVASTVSYNGLFTELGNAFVLTNGALVTTYGSNQEKSRIAEFAYPKGGNVKKNIHKVRFVQDFALSI